VSHANAALTPRARLRLAVLIVERGWTYSAAAKMFMVAPRTARKWADRYRAEGPGGMVDRSSRPHSSPAKTPPRVVRAIVGLRWRHRLGVTVMNYRGARAEDCGYLLSRLCNWLTQDFATTDPAYKFSGVAHRGDERMTTAGSSSSGKCS
jgi:hypothetical protein